MAVSYIPNIAHYIEITGQRYKLLSTQCIISDGWFVNVQPTFNFCVFLSPLTDSSVSLAGDYNGSGEYHAIS